MTEYADILLVDDVPEQIDFAGALLRGEGYRVFAVTSGANALRFLETRHPDLIMLDVQMEDMDGLKLCEILKEKPEWKDIPVIFLTAETSPEVIQKGFALGGCDYVKKPFVREEYLARVRTHLKVSRQQHELTEANNELNLFCSAVSHDLKAPFNIINMLIGMLREELGDQAGEDVDHIMDLITDKSTQAVAMVERLLEFSRMCNIQPNMANVNLEQLICETFEDLKLLEPTRDIELQCSSLPVVRGDAVLLQMAVKNLLSNAMKYSKIREKAMISVYAVKSKAYHIIKIRDNGVGFDMAYADKLFQVFQRLHPEEEFEGTGVGLALVDRIMKRHGGFVQAWGEVGQGAEFSLYFRK